MILSDTQYKAIARRFVEEIFNARELEAAKNFVTPVRYFYKVRLLAWLHVELESTTRFG